MLHNITHLYNKDCHYKKYRKPHCKRCRHRGSGVLMWIESIFPPRFILAGLAIGSCSEMFEHVLIPYVYND